MEVWGAESDMTSTSSWDSLTLHKAHYEYSHPVSLNTGSSLTLDYISKWYCDCVATHSQCQLPSPANSFRQTRLLDVGSAQQDSVRLVDTRTDENDGPYICLSHCWGKETFLTLTTDTQNLLKNGIFLTTLPKTFRDAILVTRRMGIKYLWIDSL